EKKAVNEYAAKKRKKSGGFSLFKKKEVGPIEPAPTALTEIPGLLAENPNFNLLLQHKSITYPVKEPFQFVNLTYDNGETTYNVIEPKLTKKEVTHLTGIKKTYDMLVNTDRVLVDTSDKIKFIQDVYDEIIDIQALRLSAIERQRILYYLI